MKRVSGINALALALPLLALLILVGAGAWYAFDKRTYVQSKLDELEPRYARMLGLQVVDADLDASIEKANALLAKHVYPSSQDTSQVGNAAQQRMREVFTAAGVEVVSSQILPAKASKPYERIALSVRVEGQLVGFQSAMSALAALEPTLWVESYSMQTMGNVTANAPQRLSMTLSLFVLRAL